MAKIDPTLTELFHKQFPCLSLHEASCVHLHTLGIVRKDIANFLSVSENSVTHALERAQEKFNVASNNQLRTIVQVTLSLRVLEAMNHG